MCDPMCGSGTIAIEAALIASDTAPGLLKYGPFGSIDDGVQTYQSPFPPPRAVESWIHSDYLQIHDNVENAEITNSESRRTINNDKEIKLSRDIGQQAIISLWNELYKDALRRDKRDSRKSNNKNESIVNSRESMMKGVTEHKIIANDIHRGV